MEQESDGMSRSTDIKEAIDEMRKANVTDGTLKQMQVAMLAQIATSLAVIADKMTEEVTE